MQAATSTARGKCVLRLTQHLLSLHDGRLSLRQSDGIEEGERERGIKGKQSAERREALPCKARVGFSVRVVEEGPVEMQQASQMPSLPLLSPMPHGFRYTMQGTTAAACVCGGGECT